MGAIEDQSRCSILSLDTRADSPKCPMWLKMEVIHHAENPSSLKWETGGKAKRRHFQFKKINFSYLIVFSSLNAKEIEKNKNY